MEIALDESHDSSTALPDPRLSWIPWEETRLEDHAEVKYRCFQNAIDSFVFPCLGDRQGCSILMREIRRKPGFLPAATWLIAGPNGLAGAIQGVVDREKLGAIQNVGVLPAYRGGGLGIALVRKALEGFRSEGIGSAYLEVTAENSAALRLYRAAGFRRSRTLYKAVQGS